MAFDSLSEKLQNVFKNLRSKGRLTEDDVKAALKEVKMALLEADVNFKVVKGFIKDVQERAVGQDVMNGLNPGQMVIKIVNEELVKLMGSETTEIKLQPGSAITVIMMAGLQGAGKTTTTAKLAGKFKLKGKKPLLVACDVYRPAAIKQLEINAEKQGVEMFSMGDKNKPADIAKAAVEHAAKNGNNIVILDTAGRLHVDEDMMAELQEIKESCRDAKLKVILETGALQTPESIQKTAILALYSGADFIKTSTGKGYPGATPEAVYTMCQVLKKYHSITGKRVGIKVAGGIRTAEEAVRYYTIVKEVLGNDWLNKDLFRIGASSLVEDIEHRLGK